MLDIRPNREPIPHGLFYMWRCVIAIAHADNHVSQAERDYLAKVFKNMERLYIVSDEQKATWARDMEVAQNIPDLIRNINEPMYRGQLTYFGGLLAHADGDLHPNEDAILKKLRADQMASLDMAEIRAEAKKTVESEIFQHDIKMDELRPRGTLFAVLDALLLKMGIDILE